MNLYEGMTTAIGQYVADVKSSDFPNERAVLTFNLKIVANEDCIFVQNHFTMLDSQYLHSSTML
jgi:hypothetical protein